MVAQFPTETVSKTGHQRLARLERKLFENDEDYRFTQEHGRNQSFSGYEANRLFTRHEDRFRQSQHVSGVGFRYDGRSVVAADLDRDGDLDLVIRNLKDRPIQILENRLSASRRFLQVALFEEGESGRGIGAQVTARCGDRRQVRNVTAGTGYLTQAPYDVYFGFGDCPTAVDLDVVWAGGARQHWSGIQPDARVSVRQHDPALHRVAMGRSREPSAARAGGLALLTLAGTTVPLLDPADARALVVNVWAPWCAACEFEIPQLMRWARAHKETHRVVYVSFETEDLDAVRRSARDFGIADDVRLGRDEFFERYLPEGRVEIPVTLVLGPDGTLRKRFLGSELPLEELAGG